MRTHRTFALIDLNNFPRVAASLLALFTHIFTRKSNGHVIIGTPQISDVTRLRAELFEQPIDRKAGANYPRTFDVIAWHTCDATSVIG